MAFTSTNGAFTLGPQGNTTSIPVEQTSFHQTFLKGQPKALGAIQITLAFVQILAGTVLLYTLNAYTSVTVYSFIFYWGVLFYIISGSLVVSAATKNSRGLVKGALGTNVVSGLVAFCEVSLVIIDLAHTYYFNYGPCYTNPCSLFQDTILVIRLITLIHLLLITLLQFSISITAFAFSIRSLRDKIPNNPQVIMVQNTYQNPALMPEDSTSNIK